MRAHKTITYKYISKGTRCCLLRSCRKNVSGHSISIGCEFNVWSALHHQLQTRSVNTLNLEKTIEAIHTLLFRICVETYLRTSCYTAMLSALGLSICHKMISTLLVHIVLADFEKKP